MLNSIIGGFAPKPPALVLTHQAGYKTKICPPHRSNKKCWNINQLSIDYAFRPRLRIRLTQRRLPLRWNPWAYGVRVFHPYYRYSCQHSHFRYLQQTLRSTFTGLRNAPLPCKQACIRSFGTRLSPVKSSAQDDSTSELLRFL